MKRDNWRFEALARAKIVRQEIEDKMKSEKCIYHKIYLEAFGIDDCPYGWKHWPKDCDECQLFGE